MPTNERGHTTPANTAAPSRAQIFGDFANSINDVILCDDATDRDAKITALPYTPDATRPAFFWRADATAGRQLEVWDGTTLHVYGSLEVADETATDSAAFTPSGAVAIGSVAAVRNNSVVSIQLNLSGVTVAAGEQNVTIGTVAEPFRPATSFATFNAWLGSGGMAFGMISAGGSVSVRYATEASSGGLIATCAFPSII
jgi:hypothetical protein